jgi:hypothetical protein
MYISVSIPKPMFSSRDEISDDDEDDFGARKGDEDDEDAEYPSVWPPVSDIKQTVRPEEIVIVILILILWVGAIILFVRRWGKIRMLVPYQPRYVYTDEQTNSDKLKVHSKEDERELFIHPCMSISASFVIILRSFEVQFEPGRPRRHQ